MSNRSCGTRAEKFVNTPASSGRLPAASRNRSVTDAVASTPLPSRSSILTSHPLRGGVLDKEWAPAGRAQPLDRRRLKDRHPRVADLLRQPALELTRQS